MCSNGMLHGIDILLVQHSKSDFTLKENFHLKPLLRGRGSLVQARSIKGGSQYAAGGMMAKVVLTWEGHILARGTPS